METFNKIRVVPYCSSINKLSKIAGKYHRDISEQEYQNCLNDCVVFKGSDCIHEMLDHVLSFKRENKKVNNKDIEHNLYLMAHNGSGFDSYVVFKNFPQRRSVAKLMKIGAGIISLVDLLSDGFVDQNKKFPRYVLFSCARIHITKSLKTIGES